ncbi:hypothetical protein IF2G_01958 [Cordyceps javanica]|nr:hypothetical protein IF2G_01958 [Cordyceps javanica]
MEAETDESANLGVFLGEGGEGRRPVQRLGICLNTFSIFSSFDSFSFSRCQAHRPVTAPASPPPPPSHRHRGCNVSCH